jgi:Transcriptional regulator
VDISALQAFIAVARYESFSKASEHLHLTQPAVSKRVAALEAELGTILFNRIARQVSLTENGKQLLSKAQDLVQQAEDLQRYAGNLTSDIGGTLSIAVAHHIGLHRLPPILKNFSEQYAQVRLDIRFEDSEQAFHAVEVGDIEFALITLPNHVPEYLQSQTIWRDELQLVVSPDHALAKLGIVSVEHLSLSPCVLPSPDTETHKIIRREFDQAGYTLDIQMQTNNLETLKMLTTVGLGWSLLPKTMLDEQLTPLKFESKLHRNLGLISHKKRSLSNAAKAFRTLLPTRINKS